MSGGADPQWWAEVGQYEQERAEHDAAHAPIQREPIKRHAVPQPAQD